MPLRKKLSGNATCHCKRRAGGGGGFCGGRRHRREHHPGGGKRHRQTADYRHARAAVAPTHRSSGHGDAMGARGVAVRQTGETRPSARPVATGPPSKGTARCPVSPASCARRLQRAAAAPGPRLERRHTVGFIAESPMGRGGAAHHAARASTFRPYRLGTTNSASDARPCGRCVS